MNMILQSLLGRLQNSNPVAYQFINNTMNNNGNPSELLSKMLSNSTKEQRDILIQQAKSCGCPESYLKQIQNMK